MATLTECILALGYLQGAIQTSKVLDIYQEQTGEETSIRKSMNRWQMIRKLRFNS